MTEEKQKRPPRSRQWWENHLDTCARSGKTISEYAKENDINLGNLYAWKGKLRRRGRVGVDKKASTLGMGNGKQVGNENNKLSFVEVSVDRQQPEQVVVTCPNGWSIEFSTTIDPKLLSSFLTIVEERP